MSNEEENIKGFSFRCPVCSGWIEPSNINGNCPHCDNQGFRTLRIWYGICHDCIYSFFKNGVIKCNKKHIHLPKTFCKDRKTAKDMIIIAEPEPQEELMPEPESEPNICEICGNKPRSVKHNFYNASLGVSVILCSKACKAQYLSEVRKSD